MNKKIEKKDGQLLIDITCDQQDYDKALNKAELNLVKDVTVPGYRKGHAPLDLAKRRVNPNALGEEIINNFLKATDKELTAEKVYDKYEILNIRPEVKVDKFDPKETKITVSYILRPALTKLASYKGIKTTIEEKKVTDDDVKAELETLAKENAELISVDRDAKNGDTVNIDFVGYLNGKPFDGGDGKKFDLVIGSNHFVPGFEEQLIGHKAGDNFQIEVTMPENYPDELANKKTTFKVTINSVRESQLPEINDEFATTLSGNYVSKDLKTLKEKIKNNLVEDAKKSFLNDRANDYLLKCRDASEYEISPKYVDLAFSDRLQQERSRVENQGLSLEEYLKLINKDYDEYVKELKDNVIAEIKNGLVYDAIYKEEKLPTVTNEEVEKQIGLPLSNFTKQYTSYLKSQKLNDNQINNEINHYISSLVTRIVQNKVIDRVLVLNGDKKEEKPVEKKEEKVEDKEKKTTKSTATKETKVNKETEKKAE